MCKLMIYSPETKAWLLHNGERIGANRFLAIVHEDNQSPEQIAAKYPAAKPGTPYLYSLGKEAFHLCKSCQEIYDALPDIYRREQE